MKKHRITEETLVNTTSFTKWIIRDTFKQKSIKINKLIDFSYALAENLLDVYLREMPSFGKPKQFDDKVIIRIIDGQTCVIPSTKSKTADFTQDIHIGKLLQAEAKRQNMQDALPDILYCSQSAVNRMFYNPDIDTGRLIWMSYILDYDFIRNIYLPCMAVNEKMTANDCIADPCIITIKPNTITITTEKQMGIYDGMWSLREKCDEYDEKKSNIE